MPFRNSPIIAIFSPRWVPLALTGLLLIGWLALGATGAQAQVQVEQVGEEATPEVKGASQSEVIIA